MSKPTTTTDVPATDVPAGGSRYTRALAWLAARLPKLDVTAALWVIAAIAVTGAAIGTTVAYRSFLGRIETAAVESLDVAADVAAQVTRLEGGMLVRSARGLENADGGVRSRLGFGE